MSGGIRWTDEQYRDWLRKQGKADISAAVSATHAQPNSGNGITAKNEGKEGHQRYRIEIHSKRRRLTDPDGVFAKWAIDGLVVGGLIPDDGPEWVQEVSFSQEQAEIEQTIITIKIA